MNIILRPLLATDLESILDVLTDTTVKQTYMLPDFDKREDATPLFERLMTLSTDTKHYVRCIAAGEAAMGFINDVEIKDGKIELGYALAPCYHGQGYMTQALQAAMAELFQLGYREVVCGAFSENAASMRVMEKCGMKRITFTEDIEYRGKPHLCIYYTKENDYAKIPLSGSGSR